MAGLSVRFLRFRPSGPVSAAFIRDQQSLVKTLRGPVGGGKTVSCIYDGIRRATLMPPCNDGVIRYRRAVVGCTYGQMERNLYPSWKRWNPETDPWTAGDWTGGGGRFARHVMEWDVLRGARKHKVQAEFIFAAIGDAVVEEFMRGFEPTDFWLFEMDQHVEAVLDTAITRVGRFPATGDEPDAVPREVGFHRCVVGDLNSPDVDSWYYRRFEEGSGEIELGGRAYRLTQYVQPGGRDPGAENIENLPEGYYDQQIAGLSGRRNGKHLITRMVDNRYAPSLDGDPVYGDDYADDVHLKDELPALPGVPLQLGFDQGLRRPACVGAQQDPASGQWRVLFEVVPGRMSARRFAKHVREKILEVAPGVPLADVHYADPAGFAGADREDGQTAWAEQVAAELGIVVLPTETNELEPRLEAVQQELVFRIDATTPGVVIARRHCLMLRKGFVSAYRYKRERVGSGERTSDKPEKTDESNPHDALQYLLLGAKGRYGVIAGRERDRQRAEPPPRQGEAPRWRRPPARQDDDDGCVVLKGGR